MLRASLKSLLAHKLRLGLSALAVVLGVAFVTGSLVFTDTLRKTFDDLFTQTVADVTVSPKPAFDAGINETGSTGPATLPASVLQQVRAVEGVAVAEGQVSVDGVQLIGRNGKVIGTAGPPALGIDWSDTEGISELSITAGRPPTQAGQVAVDTVAAEKGNLTVGQRVDYLLPTGARHSATLTGIFKFGTSGNLAGATLTAFDRRTAQRLLLGTDSFTSIGIRAADGVTDAVLRDRVAAAVESTYQVRTRQQQADENASDIEGALRFISIFLLVFAGIALFVGSFIILNTFSMLVAQRMRELALLRAVGASRRQVTRSVLIEALAVGVVGATVGLALGFGVALGLKALFGAVGLEISSDGLALRPRTVLAAYAVGVLVTLVAAYLPGRRASRVPPVAAMRDDVTMRTRSLRLRGAAGVVVGLLGVAATVASLGADGPAAASALVGVGALLLLVGLIVLAPVLSRPVVRLLGSWYPRAFGTVGRLGRDNATRNPRRTAATSSALMVGLALVGAMGVLAASTNASIGSLVDRSLGADLIVADQSGFLPFGRDVVGAVRAVDGVASVTEQRLGPARVAGGGAVVSGLDPRDLDDVIRVEYTAGDGAGLAGQGIVVDTSIADAKGWRVGQTVPVEFPNGGTTRLRISGTFEPNQFLGRYAVNVATLETLGGVQRVSAIYVDAADSADPGAVQRSVERALSAYPNLVVNDQTEFKEQQQKQINQLLYLIYALLALAVVIAVLGIVNTLALSVIERTREIGLLRAVGMGRGQLRGMVTLESVVIAVFGALLGIGVGIVIGTALQRALADQGIDTLSVPAGPLALFLAVSAGIGVLAAVWPARRAARLDVLRAITTE